MYIQAEVKGLHEFVQSVELGIDNGNTSFWGAEFLKTKIWVPILGP